MPRVKPIVCKTPEELAAALGLSAAEAKEWQLQHALNFKGLKKLSGDKGTREPEDRQTGGDFAKDSQ
ncbi:MAG: hypothetical protein ABSH32_11145 [Bryobacteraceae bacterium]|jgi:hypothetical protein